MKLISTLLATTLVVFVASSATVFAADEYPGTTKVEKTEAVKTDAAKPEKSKTKKPVKKHSHMEEKTGMPMSEPMPDMHKEMPKDRHDHTKEKN